MKSSALLAGLALAVVPAAQAQFLDVYTDAVAARTARVESLPGADIRANPSGVVVELNGVAFGNVRNLSPGKIGSFILSDPLFMPTGREEFSLWGCREHDSHTELVFSEIIDEIPVDGRIVVRVGLDGDIKEIRGAVHSARKLPREATYPLEKASATARQDVGRRHDVDSAKVVPDRDGKLRYVQPDPNQAARLAWKMRLMSPDHGEPGKLWVPVFYDYAVDATNGELLAADVVANPQLQRVNIGEPGTYGTEQPGKRDRFGCR